MPLLVLRAGVPIGVAFFSTSSDLFEEAVFATRADTQPIGLWGCDRGPEMERPHAPFVRVELRPYVDTWAEGPTVMLFCDTCQCLIAPPTDGYVSLDYPAEWLALAPTSAA